MVAKGNKNYASVDGVLFSKDKKALLRYPGGKTASTYAIPSSVSSIGYTAFDYCDDLTSVTVPASVTSIDGYAFQGCESLTSMTILNPNCDIYAYSNTLGVPDTTVISGYEGSTAEKYAKEYDYTFKSLGAAPGASTPTPKPTATPIPALAAPSAKIALASNGGIQVSWNKISGVPFYTVYYRENNGSWNKIGTTSATSYTAKASNLKSGATYQFTVRCCAADKNTLLSYYAASNSLKYLK